MKPESPLDLHLSGERFSVTYSMWGSEEEVQASANALTIEETVEYPADVLPDGDIRDQLTGSIQSITHVEGDHWQMVMSYAIETSSYELLQLLNVIYGNVSMITNVRAEAFSLPAFFPQTF